MARYLRYSCLILSLTIFGIGLCYGDFNILLWGNLCLLASNLCYALEDLRNHIFFLFFQITFFVFLMARPVISMARGDEWWYYDTSAVFFALFATFVSLLCMQLGAIFARRYLCKLVHVTPRVFSFNSSSFQRSLRIIAFIFWVLTMACFLIGEAEKLIFMQGKAYEDYYILFQSSLPFYIRIPATLMVYALCIYLATLPSKNWAFFVLAVYVLSAVPTLIIGMRNPIVENLIFAFLYFFIRDTLGDKKKWIGRAEKTILICAVPAVLILLSAYNYSRQGEAVATTGAWEAIVDLFYKQGVSFEVLCIGFQSLPHLPNPAFKNYTFGPFIDYFTHSGLSNKLFGTLDIGEGNSVEYAFYGNSFAHSMSYTARDDYLSGHGWGSSYILESFADGGIIGLILFSLCLGFFLLFLMRMMRGGAFARIFALCSLLSLFFMPRGSATSSFLFIATVQFWVVFLFCFIAAGLCARPYSGIGCRSLFERKNKLLCKTEREF